MLLKKIICKHYSGVLDLLCTVTCFFVIQHYINKVQFRKGNYQIRYTRVYTYPWISGCTSGVSFL